MSESLSEHGQTDEAALEDVESPSEGGAGVDVTSAEGEGSTFEPEEDPEAAR